MAAKKAAAKKAAAPRKPAAPRRRAPRKSPAAAGAGVSAKRPPLCPHGMPWFTATACRLEYLAGRTCVDEPAPAPSTEEGAS